MPISLRPGRLASSSATYLLANLLSAAVPFLLLPILTRHMTPAEYGEVALFQSLVAGLGAFVGLSVQGAANRKYYDCPDDPAEIRDFISACLQILLGTSALAALLLLVFRVPVAAALGLDAQWFGGAILVSLSTFLAGLRLGQWQVRQQAQRYAVFQVAQAAAAFVTAIIAVVLLQEGVAGRLQALIATAVIFAGLALLSLRREGLLGLRWRPDLLREALAFGLPLVPHIAGIFLLGMADRFLIGRELGAGPVGIYMVAAQVAMVLALLADAINKAYVPWLFERLKRDDAAEKHDIVRKSWQYFAVALLLAAAMALLGPCLLPVLAGPGYAAAGALIGWLALGQAFGGMYLMVTNYVFFSKRTGGLSLVTIGSGAVNILLILVLIPPLGLAGVAIAYAFSMGLRFLLTWRLAQHCHPMPWWERKKYS
ncbi:MAG TPA: oligosaccharide flippase family protein [Moraxellaceae bacterium]